MSAPTEPVVTHLEVGAVVVLNVEGLDELITKLVAAGYEVKGPTVGESAIVPGPIRSVNDLPKGVHDAQSPGSYRISASDDHAFFAWAVGPESWKQEHFPPSQIMWRGESDGDTMIFREPLRPSAPLAILGARPCEVVALRVMDRVLRDGDHRDERFSDRRDASFIAVVECATPADTCFCSSMHSGPEIDEGFDVALTELDDERGHRFLARCGSTRGAELLSLVPTRRAGGSDFDARASLLNDASARMSRSMPYDTVASLLARNTEHPRWSDVAERCLSCGNCTLVCPTCFCSDVHDTTDLLGSVERRRTWSSCFDLEHSYVHGGAVRASTSSRYRQWMTHKLSTWWDQFDTTGCVGCGRCLVWCPVGIDITEEVAAIAASDGAKVEVRTSRSSS
ncbi:MAG: 4Fe-4S dicluster domain-containing protein [Acidimicrobiales bacterium]